MFDSDLCVVNTEGEGLGVLCRCDSSVECVVLRCLGRIFPLLGRWPYMRLSVLQSLVIFSYFQVQLWFKPVLI